MALGKGLDALFDENKILEDARENGQVVYLSLDDIRPNPYQPRQTFDDKTLEELADSIRQHGVFQPIIVREAIIGYEILAGERRFRASKIAKLQEIPAIIKSYSDEEMLEISILENIQREDLNVIDEAQAYANMQQKLGITIEETAKRAAKSRSHVNNLLRLLTLPKEIQEKVREGILSNGHARALIMLDIDKALDFAERIEKEHLSVRDVERLVQEESEDTPVIKQPKKIKQRSTYSDVEERMRTHLGTKVSIRGNVSGKIEIEYLSKGDLKRIVSLLGFDEK